MGRVAPMPRRKSRGTLIFVFVACAALWLFGLNEPGLSSLHLFVLAVGGLLALIFAAVLRRRVEHARERTVGALGTLPPTSVALRRYGAGGNAGPHR